MKEITQFPLRYDKVEDIKELAVFLEKKGYEILHGLSEPEKLKEHIVALVVDSDDKTLFQSNVTCMAAWSNFKRTPISVKQFISLYERIVVNKDYEHYEQLIDIRNNPNGPRGGLISPKEALNSSNERVQELLKMISNIKEEK